MKKIVSVVLLFMLFVPVLAMAWGGPATYKMKEGDTLWDLSARHYGDPTLYPIFLEVNNISNVRTIPIGTEIIIPSVSEIQKISREHDPQKRKELIDKIQGDSGVSKPSDDPLDKPLIENNSSNPSSSSSKSSYTPKPGPVKFSFQDVLEGPNVKGEELKEVKTIRKY